MSIQSLCDGIESDKLFNDELFWEMAEDDNPGYSLARENREGKAVERRRKSRTASKVGELRVEGVTRNTINEIKDHNPFFGSFLTRNIPGYVMLRKMHCSVKMSSLIIFSFFRFGSNKFKLRAQVNPSSRSGQ